MRHNISEHTLTGNSKIALSCREIKALFLVGKYDRYIKMSLIEPYKIEPNCNLKNKLK